MLEAEKSMAAAKTWGWGIWGNAYPIKQAFSQKTNKFWGSQAEHGGFT